MDHGTVLINITQPDSPAVLVSTAHNKSDLLSAATLKNVGQISLTAYRLGWVVMFSSGSNEVYLGVLMNVSAGIEPGAVWDTPPQSVSPEFGKEGATAIVFFVAEAYPSGEKPWKADLVQTRKQAGSIVASS